MQAVWEQEYEVNLNLGSLLSREEGCSFSRNSALGLECLSQALQAAAAQPHFHASSFWLLAQAAAHDLSTLEKERKGNYAGWEEVQGEHCGRGKFAGLRPGARTQQTIDQAMMEQAWTLGTSSQVSMVAISLRVGVHSAE